VVALVEALIVEVPELVALDVNVPRATVELESVKVNVSSTDAVTVTCPAVDVATVPLSMPVVHAASEKVAMRKKYVELVALGLVTAVKLTVWFPLDAVALAALTIRSEPAVAVLAVQPVVEPSPVGCAPIDEPVIENPAGVVHAPDAVVHAVNEADLTAVAVGTVKLNVYEVDALATELPIVTDRLVICAADTIVERAGTKVPTAKTATRVLMIVNFTIFISILSTFLFLFLRLRCYHKRNHEI
jgi:hypothetical protein